LIEVNICLFSRSEALHSTHSMISKCWSLIVSHLNLDLVGLPFQLVAARVALHKVLILPEQDIMYRVQKQTKYQEESQSKLHLSRY
jgi:hypothetical protein